MYEPGVVVTPVLDKIAKLAAVPRSIRSNLSNEQVGCELGAAVGEAFSPGEELGASLGDRSPHIVGP
jgi:hypothetical protein